MFLIPEKDFLYWLLIEPKKIQKAVTIEKGLNLNIVWFLPRVFLWEGIHSYWIPMYIEKHIRTELLCM